MANSNGATTLYFHGLPGSVAELESLGPVAAQKARHFHVVDRSSLIVGSRGEGYFERMAARIGVEHPTGPLRLVGFSLGAAAALRVAPMLGGRIERIDLIAPAGPLSLGDFLDGMAGAPVFRSALAGKLPFAGLTFLQAQVARIAPGRMAVALMSRAEGEDKALARDPSFMAGLARSLRHSLLLQRRAYQQEIMLYVSNWATDLSKVTHPVAIWQGSEDDWAPPAMAQALARVLPECREPKMLQGLSHFSTLRWYLQEGGV